MSPAGTADPATAFESSPETRGGFGRGDRTRTHEVSLFLKVRGGAPDVARVRPPSSTRRLGRRRRNALLVLALVAAGVAVYLPLRSGSPAGPRIAEYRGPVPRFTVPSGYHVTFDVTVRGHQHTEELFVKRPFASYEEVSSGGKPYLVTAMRLGQQV